MQDLHGRARWGRCAYTNNGSAALQQRASGPCIGVQAGVVQCCKSFCLRRSQRRIMSDHDANYARFRLGSQAEASHGPSCCVKG